MTDDEIEADVLLLVGVAHDRGGRKRRRRSRRRRGRRCGISIHRLVLEERPARPRPAESELDHLLLGPVVSEAEAVRQTVFNLRGRHHHVPLRIRPRSESLIDRVVPQVRFPVEDPPQLGRHLPGLVTILRPDRTDQHGSRRGRQERSSPDDRPSHRFPTHRAARAASAVPPVEPQFCKGMPSFPELRFHGGHGRSRASGPVRGEAMRRSVIWRGALLASAAAAMLAGPVWAQNRDKAWEVTPELGWIFYGKPHLGDDSIDQTFTSGADTQRDVVVTTSEIKDSLSYGFRFGYHWTKKQMIEFGFGGTGTSGTFFQHKTVYRDPTPPPPPPPTPPPPFTPTTIVSDTHKQEDVSLDLIVGHVNYVYNFFLQHRGKVVAFVTGG